MSNKDTSVNQRIKFLIDDYEKCSQKIFADKIGISQSAVSALFSQRENRPGLEMLQKIAIAYPEISLDWLLTGRGPMLPKSADKKNDYSGHIGKFPVKSASGNPEVAIIAGNQYNRLKWDYLRRNDSDKPDKEEETAYALSNTSYAYESLSLPPSMLKHGLTRAFPMPSSNMEPTFGEGDLIIATLLQKVDWSTFPRESDKFEIIDTFPMCVVEVRNKQERRIEFGRCCVDDSVKSLRCFSDNRTFYPSRIDLKEVTAIWEFNCFLSQRALNPAQQLIYRVGKAERELEEIKAEAKRYVRLKLKLRELILRWRISMVTLAQDFGDCMKDETVREYYTTEVGEIDERGEEFASKLLTIIQPLIVELAPTLEADRAKPRVFKNEPGMPPYLPSPPLKPFNPALDTPSKNR